MTIKDKDGKEWVLVPVEATREMLRAVPLDTISAAGMWRDYIAAAPQFVPPAVTDEVVKNIGRQLWIEERAVAPLGLTHLGRGRVMIAAVQQVLGPTLGLAPIDDAMRKDAERYQWLCKSSGIPKDGLDAAIAKAMGGGNG